jgi:hypothetical protein
MVFTDNSSAFEKHKQQPGDITLHGVNRVSAYISVGWRVIVTRVVLCVAAGGLLLAFKERDKK